MEKKKISELALDLGMDVKELLSVLKEIGISGKSSKSKIEENELDYMFQALTSKIAVASIEDIMNENAVRLINEVSGK